MIRVTQGRWRLNAIKCQPGFCGRERFAGERVYREPRSGEWNDTVLSRIVGSLVPGPSGGSRQRWRHGLRAAKLSHPPKIPRLWLGFTARHARGERREFSLFTLGRRLSRPALKGRAKRPATTGQDGPSPRPRALSRGRTVARIGGIWQPARVIDSAISRRSRGDRTSAHRCARAEGLHRATPEVARRLTLVDRLLPCGGVIHVSRNEPHRLTESLGRERLVADDVAATDRDQDVAIFDHRSRRRRELAASGKKTTPSRVLHEEDRVDVRRDLATTGSSGRLLKRVA